MSYKTGRIRLTVATMATVAVAAMVLMGCGGGASALVGNWVLVDGNVRDKPRQMELFQDGTGVVDGNTATWKVESERFIIQSATADMACDYKISDMELVLSYDDGSTATFVKEDEVEAWEAEGNKGYPTTKIGNNVWMAKNLNIETADSWCYDGDDSNCARYGRLYSWAAAMTACPEGWRLPTRADWNGLVSAASGDNAGANLKAGAPDWDGTNNVGFSALPGGRRHSNGSFEFVGTLDDWWTATESDGSNAYSRDVNSGRTHVREETGSKAYGLSVRCVRE